MGNNQDRRFGIWEKVVVKGTLKCLGTESLAQLEGMCTRTSTVELEAI